ncbi:endo-beta-N-acetylglucosaminidase [Streptomyces youssoufiensis]
MLASVVPVSERDRRPLPGVRHPSDAEARAEAHAGALSQARPGGQSELNDANKMFLQDGGVRVSDSLFLDYRRNQSKLTTSGEKATGELKRSRYDVYAGVKMSRATPLDPETACPQGKQHLTSVALLVPEDKSMPEKVNGKYKTMDLADFYTKEARTWVGANGNPSSTPTKGWPGIARYVAEPTPVRRLPFVTPGAPANVRNLGTVALPNSRKGLRLAWTPSAPEPAVHHYEVYRRRPQNASPLYLGGTPNTVYYVDQLDKQGQTTITLDVVAVGPDGTRSASTPFCFTWS